MEPGDVVVALSACQEALVDVTGVAAVAVGGVVAAVDLACVVADEEEDDEGEAVQTGVILVTAAVVVGDVADAAAADVVVGVAGFVMCDEEEGDGGKEGQGHHEENDGEEEEAVDPDDVTGVGVGTDGDVDSGDYLVGDDAGQTAGERYDWVRDTTMATGADDAATTECVEEVGTEVH